MFVDASAIGAILIREPEAERVSDLVERAAAPVTSAIAVFEAALGFCHKRHASIEEDEADMDEFLVLAEIKCVPISGAESQTALRAVAHYGKDTGHPTQLDLGDCFAYAVARNRRVPLLFKGGAFTHTDIEAADERPGCDMDDATFRKQSGKIARVEAPEPKRKSQPK